VGVASTSGANANKNGPGTFSDTPSAFEAQATKLSAEPAPDANVAVAYALGWAVGDALTCTKYQVFDHLVKVPEHDTPAAQWKLLVQQIRSRCGHINIHLKTAKADLDLNCALDAAAKLLLELSPGDINEAVGAKNKQAIELHAGILAVLWPVASPLAKSYHLGHVMQRMCTTPLAEKYTKVNAPAQPTTVAISVKTYSAEVHRLLTALGSKLPANAAHATDNSLLLWRASLDAGGDEIPENLLLQARRWHDVLDGDISGKDGLRPEDLGAVAEGFTRRLWQIAWQVGGRLVILLVGAALAGVGLIIWGAPGAIGAGIAALVATFGLAWRVGTDFFGRVGARGEEQLWDAEIEWAIAYRFTILRNPPADSQLKPRSYALPFLDQSTKKHVKRYKEVKRSWPDVFTS
jgi:hypothetical protein